MVRRSYENNPSDILPVSSEVALKAWYLVQGGSHAGWILGRRVHLDIPKSISAYAQDTNLVAWLVLNTVDDSGHLVPQYLVADRLGTQACDFTDIRVLTWWKKKQTYAIAYNEGGLKAIFPSSSPTKAASLFFASGSWMTTEPRAKSFTDYLTQSHALSELSTLGRVMPCPSPRAFQSRIRRVSAPSLIGVGMKISRPRWGIVQRQNSQPALCHGDGLYAVATLRPGGRASLDPRRGYQYRRRSSVW